MIWTTYVNGGHLQIDLGLFRAHHFILLGSSCLHLRHFLRTHLVLRHICRRNPLLLEANRQGCTGKVLDAHLLQRQGPKDSLRPVKQLFLVVYVSHTG